MESIRYDLLVQQALRGMVRDLLSDAAKGGLPGEHHFFITFVTTAEDVRLSDRLREQYPEEMTVVLQYQFRDLKVTDRAFEVVLSFGGVPERLVVPLEAIKGFADPSVQFQLQFEALELADEDELEPDQGQNKGFAAVPATTPGAAPGPNTTQDSVKAADSIKPAPADDKAGAEVVRLDRFRKK